MKKVLIFSLLWSGIASAQVNVYDCYVYPGVPQYALENSDFFSAPCVSFEQATTYTFGQNDTKTVTAAKQIVIEPGFSAENFTGSGFMDLHICTDLKDIVSFSHNDLNEVEALKKFEFGLQLPQEIEDRIQFYIATGDSTDPVNGGINPYLEWQISAKASCVERGTGVTKTIFGFYFQDFERDRSDAIKNNWHWDQVATSHHMRFRYSPPKPGIFDIFVDVTLGDGTVFTYCPFSIRATPNTDNDGYIEVAPNKRVLQRQEELFFPVGQNTPFPRESGPDIGGWVGAYGIAPVNSSPFYEFDTLLNELGAAGLNYYRLLLNPSCLDIEFEEVGNYTDRLNFGWEIDKIIERSESLDLYIHFNMMVHFAFESPSAGAYLNWDWSDRYIEYGDPVYQGQFGYKSKFNLPDTAPQSFLSDPGCRKFYKQKIRYLISRYGYSTHVALFELMSEMSNVGKTYDIINTIGQNGQPLLQLNNKYEAYLESPEHRLWVAWWHDEMAKYIKNDLGHTEHLVAVSYGRLPIAPDYSYGIPEVDVITYNRYSDILGGKYQRYVLEADSLFQIHQKPYMHSETGPTSEYDCDDGTTYLKEAWMAAFTGVAGFNMWNGFLTPELCPRLGEIRRFIHDNPEITEIFMGNWKPIYRNDALVVPSEDPNGYARLKELVAISALDSQGSPVQKEVGVISNVTDNFFTNDLGTTSWCANQANFILSSHTTKQDLYYYNAPFVESNVLTDYYFEWYNNEGDFLYSNNALFSTVVYWPHPLSCATSGCLEKTSEIPFVRSWELSFLGRNEGSGNRAMENSYGNNKLSHSENSKLFVAPNPAATELHIYTNDSMIRQLVILDASGRLIHRLFDFETTETLDISNYDSGIFVILGIDADGQIKYSERWVKL